MIFTSYQMMKETAVCWHIWLRLASGVWLGLETGHSSQRKTAPEQGFFVAELIVKDKS